MNCLSCGTAAAPRNRFCTQCGAALPVACTACGQANEPGAKFCGSCGAGLAAPVPATTAATTERRHLTLMFCDLVDSTALSRRLDPEDLAHLINAYQSHCAEAINRYGGMIVRFLGDGILVYFGYPRAHENDAERAVRAALKITAEIGTVAPLGVTLRTRIGIASGLVLIRDLVGIATVPELEAIGSTPNLAARIQAVTAPNTVVICDNTRRLIGGLFECADLGLHDFKGFAEPVQAWRVDGEQANDSRFDAFHDGRFTPLIGREREMDLLLARWDAAKQGHGQAVFVSADAGIGKSRLLHEFRMRLTREPHWFVGLACSPFHQNSALYPVAVELARLAQIESDDTPAARLLKLETLAAEAQRESAETIPLLAALLSVPTGDKYPPLALSPTRRKQRTLEVLVALIAALAADLQVVVQVEDAHWIDPTSQDLVDALLAAIKNTRVLVVVAFRPEFHPPWRGSVPVAEITLARLTREHASAMVAQLTRLHALPARTIADVLDKTDGVPLFIEELTKAVLEADIPGAANDGEAPVALPVPSTLQASLTARLDRLAAGKEVAQIGAVIGRSFPFRLLAAISPLNEATLNELLDRLVKAELVFAAGQGGNTIYTFKHALVQDASYETLLLSKRRRIHAAIARAIEERFPDQAAGEPELVAHHFTRAGQPLDAIPYWLKAGQRAATRSAASEAIAQLNRGLDLLKHLPAGAERDAHEFELRLALGQVFIATRGHAAPEVGQAFGRARELCTGGSENPRLTMVLMGLGSFHQMRGELGPAIGFAEDLLRHTETQPEPAARALGHRGIAVPLLYLGEFRRALDHLECGLALYDPKQSRNFQLVNDPRVTSWSLMSGGLARLGFVDQAKARSRAALAEARALHQPFDLAGALHHACFLYKTCREHRTVAEHADALVKLSLEQTFPNYHATGTIFRGWAAATAGDSAAGIAEMQRGIDAYRATGAAINLPSWLGMLAEGFMHAGDSDRAARLAEEALTIVAATGERGYESDLERLAGDIALDGTPGDTQKAERHLNRALDVARAQDARLFELRAAASLVRLWRTQGKTAASRDLLAGLIDWFKEGSETQDQIDARNLLAVLA
jgi:class 3 adenylate cyclase/predicted ATPase